MTKKHAILVLEGPMQSWGLQGKFDHRDTATLPTKSGVVGLICAALGVERDDRDHIAEIASFDISVITLKRGVMMTDYHTVGCGHEREDSRVLKAEKGSTQVVTHRDYLADAAFVVVVSGLAELIDRCSSALDNPKWGGYLGRRSCIPSRPVLEVVVDTEEQVRAELSRLGATSESVALSDGIGGTYQQDAPIDFRTREYGTRPVVQESCFVR
jgi:CRISPR system Cascade subunit CasD